MTRASSRVTNEVEIRLIGLRRSGNHAIVDWLTAQHRRGRLPLSPVGAVCGIVWV
ncbi:MAG: hypothetical protein RIE08_08765 [Acidimicrobiales bacterium]